MTRDELVQELLDFKDRIGFWKFWKEQPDEDMAEMLKKYVGCNEADEACGNLMNAIHADFAFRKGLIESGQINDTNL